MMSLHGYYLNLDRSPERRAIMEKAIESLPFGFPVERFPAIESEKGRGDLAPSEVGCYLSHRLALKNAPRESHTLILKDDVQFAPAIGQGLEFALSHLDKGTLDVVFLSQTAQYNDLRLHHALIALQARLARSGDRDRFLMLRAENYYRWGAFGYIVARNARDRVVDRLDSRQQTESPVQIDRLYGNLVREGALKAGVVFPYVVGVNLSLPSTMHGRASQQVHDLHTSLVNVYLKGANLEGEVPLWNEILSEGANEQALAVARMVYRKLTTH